MAADGVDELKLQLIHGQNKYDFTISLSVEEAGDVLTVGHLATKVQELTDVPPKNQKLICKGKSLSQHLASLKELGLKNGSKIMLIGRKVNSEDDGLLKKIGGVEKSINNSEKKLSDVIYELDGIHRGYLAKDHEKEAITKLARRLLVVNEEFTKQLEELDSLVLGQAASEVRAQRKKLVTRIQMLLERSDKIQVGVNEMIARL